MYNNIKKFGILFLKITISVLSLIYVWNKIDRNALYQILQNAKYIYLLAAFIFFIASKIVSAYRLNVYFNKINIKLPDVSNIKLYWLGMYYNLFLPGGIGGDAYKIYLLNKHYTVGHKKILSAVFIDRVSGVFALGVLFLGLFVFSSFNNSFIISVCVLLSIPLLFLIFNLAIKSWFSSFKEITFKTNLYAFAVQLLQIISVVFIMKGLNVLEHEIDYILIFLLSSIVAILPISIGGIGARELVFMYAGNMLLLNTASSVSISILFFIITAVGSLWGMVYAFDQKKIILT